MRPFSGNPPSLPAATPRQFAWASATHLLSSPEVRTFLGSVVLVGLTWLFGPPVTCLLVGAVFFGFLLGGARATLILKRSADCVPGAVAPRTCAVETPLPYSHISLPEGSAEVGHPVSGDGEVRPEPARSSLRFRGSADRGKSAAKVPLPASEVGNGRRAKKGSAGPPSKDRPRRRRSRPRRGGRGKGTQ